MHFRGRNFREQKLSQISRILAKFLKVNVAKYFKDIDLRKFMNAKNSFFLEFVKVNVREKKLKTKIIILFIYSKRQIWLN